MSEEKKIMPEEEDRAEKQKKDTKEDPKKTSEKTDDAVESLKTEMEELKDRLMRAVAETENVRRRAERDRQEAAAYAMTAFARDLLAVSDNLRRTLDSLPKEARENDIIKPFIEGVEMTERELLSSFERHGIRQINPKGKKFDHNFHQAMFEIEDADVPPGQVVEVAQSGYVIKDRLLRPAMVGVSKKPGNKEDNKKD